MLYYVQYTCRVNSVDRSSIYRHGQRRMWDVVVRYFASHKRFLQPAVQDAKATNALEDVLVQYCNVPCGAVFGLAAGMQLHLSFRS